MALADRNTTALILNVTEPWPKTVFDEYLVCVAQLDIGRELCPSNATEPYPASDDLIIITDLTAGSTYYVAVYTSSNGQPSDDWVDITETTCKLEIHPAGNNISRLT